MLIRKCLQATDGAVAISTAVLMTALIGFTALGVEAGLWYSKQRSMQGAADAAALGAAMSLAGTGTCSNGSTCTWKPGVHGLSLASVDSWTAGSNSVQVTVVSPPTVTAQSSLLSDPNAVEVLISQPQSLLFTNVLHEEFGLPVPTIGAHAIATKKVSSYSDCVLALANDPQAIYIQGSASLTAACGLAVDGGIDQNGSTTPNGSITFNGNSGAIYVTSLAVAKSTVPATPCPTTSQCWLYPPPTGKTAPTPLPAADIYPGQPTLDPYKDPTKYPFPAFPKGVASIKVASSGTSYTTGTVTFRLNNGTTKSGTTADAATFTVTADKTGKLSDPVTVTDPGAYTVLPTSPATATVVSPTGDKGKNATFTVTEGCFAWTGTAIPNRKYCSVNITNTVTIQAGNYYIAGGDDKGKPCGGFCVSNNAGVTTVNAGATFFLGQGAGSTASSYAVIQIQGGGTNSISLCAPGTNCGTTCDQTSTNPYKCFLFFQDRAATTSTSLSAPGANAWPSNTVNSFQGGLASNFSGLIYIPQQTLRTQGNAGIQGCVGVVAKYFDFGGTPSFTNGCLPGNGIGGATNPQITLAE